MIVYDFVDEQPATSDGSSPLVSIEPLISDKENAPENSNETNVVSHVVIAEASVPNPRNVDEAVGTLGASSVLFDFNVENHDVDEANGVGCELEIEW